MRFLIDSDTDTPRPVGDIKHINAKHLGTSTYGWPTQGEHISLVARFPVLTYAQMHWLVSKWDPNNPEVTVSYDDPITGTYVTQSAIMHEPQEGSRSTMFYYDVAVTFGRLT